MTGWLMHTLITLLIVMPLQKMSHTSLSGRETSVKPVKLYKKYNANDADTKEIMGLNDAAGKLADIGFIRIVAEKFGTQIQKIVLIDSMLADVENFLSSEYGYVTKDMQIQEVRDIISECHNSSPICSAECRKLEDAVMERNVPKNYQQLRDIYRAVAFIENNSEILYLREASAKIYGDTKYFEENTLKAVCSLLHRYCMDEKDMMLDEILSNYKIYREPRMLCIRGSAVIETDCGEIDVGTFRNGIEFHADELEHISAVRINAPVFMTIENRTSYLRFYRPEWAVTFYLGGYADRWQRDFIKKVTKSNIYTTYMHFGDIDAGGFYIHQNLCEITGTDFGMFHMSVDDLTDERYKNCVKKLTENDRNRLSCLEETDQYSEVVRFMIENDMKLEQEIISFEEMKHQSPFMDMPTLLTPHDRQYIGKAVVFGSAS